MSAVVTALDKTRATVAGVLSGPVRKLMGEWDCSKAAEALMQARLVRPLWNPGSEVDLTTFYQPCVLRRGRLTDQPIDVSGLPATRVVITGIVGQGKSLLLKFLACQELSTYQQGRAPLPLLVELRKMTDSRLDHFLISSLQALGVGIEEKVLDHLLSNGHLALLLDGLDEVPRRTAGELTTQLERLGLRYPKLRIVLTSRPKVAGVEHMVGFEAWHLPPLDGEARVAVLRAQYGAENRAQADRLLSEVQDRDLWRLVTTPLMSALMIVHYNAYQKLPERPESFFDDLFDALLRRHDATKPGFVRPRESLLGDFDFRRWFDRLCFAALRSQRNAWPRQDMLELVSKASPAGIPAASVDLVLDDIVQITALVQEEGGECRFLHKSIVEYHAAACVKNLPEPGAKKFYALMLTAGWSEWQQVIDFLSRIDRYRYLRYLEAAKLKDVLDCPSLRSIYNDVPITVLRTNAGTRIDIDVRARWFSSYLQKRAPWLHQGMRKLVLDITEQLDEQDDRVLRATGELQVSAALIDELDASQRGEALVSRFATNVERWYGDLRLILAEQSIRDPLLDF